MEVKRLTELMLGGAEPVTELDARVQAHLSAATPDREELADLLPKQWTFWHAIGNAGRLREGEAIYHFKALELWREYGYRSFKAYWREEGLDGVQYKRALHWATYWRTSRLAGLTDVQAGQQSMRKVVAAAPMVRRASERGEDLPPEVRQDLVDPDVGRDEFVERHVGVRLGEGQPGRDRVTVHSATGQIMGWLNTQSPAVGVEMGFADLSSEDSQEFWQRLMDREIEVVWI